MSVESGKFIQMAKGYVFEYDVKKGFGFIQPTHKQRITEGVTPVESIQGVEWVDAKESGRKYDQVFCHYKSVQNVDGHVKLSADQEVVFSIFLNDKGYNAQNVYVIGYKEDEKNGNC